jgi:dihydrofolate reductase
LKTPTVTLIAAVARNGAIGAGNAIPWRLPSDLRRFKALTMGKPLIMGRKTFESIGRPLPGRRIIVVTRDVEWSFSGVAIARDVDTAIDLACSAGPSEIVIGGGGEIYAHTIARADQLHITEVDLAPASDVQFPAIESGSWREVRRVSGVRGPGDEADFKFVDYNRLRK